MKTKNDGNGTLPLALRERAARRAPARVRASGPSRGEVERCVRRKNCFLKKLIGVRKLTTFYVAKNDHRWVTFISLETITLASAPPSRLRAKFHQILC